MKNRTINIILGVILCISVCGNIFLIKSWINDIEQLEKQLADNESQINTLENALSESETQIENLKEAIAKPTEMDAVINSYDDNISGEVVAPVENPIIDYEVNEIEPTTLYAIQNVNLRQGPSAEDFEKIGSLYAREQVTIVGIVNEYKEEMVLWYQLDTGEFVSGAYLVEKLPVETTPQQPQQQPIMNENGTITIGDVTLSFPEGTSDGLGGMNYGGQATAEGDGSLADAPTLY